MPASLVRAGRLLPAISVSLILGARLAALKAAGLNGTAPPHAAEFRQLIGTLTDNWTWLVATGMGLVLILLGGMMVFGDIRAPERLFRVAGGVMVILVVIPAVLA
jgi:hypothetical protein